MSLADARRAIESRFAAAWDDTTPIAFEAVKFEIPTPPSPLAWVAIYVREGGGLQASMNAAPLHRFFGQIAVNVFTPQNVGAGDGAVLADAVSTIFRRAVFSLGSSGQIVCGTPTATPLGIDPAGWFQHNVATPYTRNVYF